MFENLEGKFEAADMFPRKILVGPIITFFAHYFSANLTPPK